MTTGASAPPGPHRTRASATPTSEASDADPLRVMVVDDSAVIRGLLTRAIEADPECHVVSSVGDGQMAINAIQRQPIDVVVLDIEMPVMDGLTALPKLLAASPATKVVVASTLTKRNAEISLKCMQLGAADYVPKPTTTRDIHGGDSFKVELLTKVKTLGAAARRAGGAERQRRAAAKPLPARVGARPVGTSHTPIHRPAGGGAPKLRPVPAGFTPDVIAIGSSTGGPQALFEVLSHLRGFKQPILITQHMPATFTTILAEHITRQCGIPTKEGTDGEALVGGRCFLAPGNYHMVIEPRAGSSVIRINQDPPENFCRPAVDPMLRSIGAVYGRKTLALILTGMGQDGMLGARNLVERGSVLIAQDEASSVVWGMPGAVANDGTCSAILPLSEIGPFMRKLALRSAA